MVRTYDPKQIIVGIVTKDSANATYRITGFADGTAVKVSRSVEAYTKSTGMDGETSRVKNNDRSGEITLTLAQTSPSNDALSALEQKTSDGDTAEIHISDLYGRSYYSSTSAWVKKHPDSEFAKGLTNREWTFECADLDMTTAGTAV